MYTIASNKENRKRNEDEKIINLSKPNLSGPCQIRNKEKNKRQKPKNNLQKIRNFLFFTFKIRKIKTRERITERNGTQKIAGKKTKE